MSSQDDLNQNNKAPDPVYEKNTPGWYFRNRMKHARNMQLYYTRSGIYANPNVPPPDTPPWQELVEPEFDTITWETRELYNNTTEHILTVNGHTSASSILSYATTPLCCFRFLRDGAYRLYRDRSGRLVQCPNLDAAKNLLITRWENVKTQRRTA